MCTRREEDGKPAFSDQEPAGDRFRAMMSTDQSLPGYEATIIQLVRHATPPLCASDCRPGPLRLAEDLCRIYTPQAEDDVHPPRRDVMVKWAGDFHAVRASEVV
ncbi:hypothetical protein [Nocardiopsis metallicus]|uniref:Uncharacterized protein n=1 Tax=Nocardiopsis metallicus TaxID=179819 RepID=A0A840WIZ8_9ACTN|nr:hypothetical protein [Nocardiopsis metallicus]MBB5491516.1 hypothetical protein [Nocardiopsis metallicus]